MPERLQKFLARAGVASRRRAEELITEGRVAVNNVVVRELGTKVEAGRDLVTVDGKLVEPATDRVYFILYKPVGVVTTMEDPQGRPTVADYARNVGRRVFPVGRLDFDAEGALLLTDDGTLANALTHPSFEVRRTYLAKVKGTPDAAALQRLKDGVRLEDGMAHALEADIFEQAERNTWIRIVVGEGRQHMVKRLCAAIGHPVVRLFRPAHGGIGVEGLRPGELRPLSGAEVERAKAVAAGSGPPAEPISLPPRRHGRGAPGFEDDDDQEAMRAERVDRGEASGPLRAGGRERGEVRRGGGGGRRDERRDFRAGSAGRGAERGGESRGGTGERRERRDFRPGGAGRGAERGGEFRGGTGERRDRPDFRPGSAGRGAERGGEFRGGTGPRGGAPRGRGEPGRPGRGEAGGTGRGERGSYFRAGSGERGAGSRPPPRGERFGAGSRPPPRGDRPGTGSRPPPRGDRPGTGSRPPPRGERPVRGERVEPFERGPGAFGRGERRPGPPGRAPASGFAAERGPTSRGPARRGDRGIGGDRGQRKGRFGALPKRGGRPGGRGNDGGGRKR